MGRKIFPLVSFTLLIFSSIFSNAQKLPNKQAVSLSAPPNIKIDGKSTEWNNKFQAYNSATNISYTLANDSANLYLTIQATGKDLNLVEEVIKGGVVFTIKAPNKKSEKGNIALTFPIWARRTSPGISLVNNPLPANDSLLAIKVGDSLMSVYNKTLVQITKVIKIEGIEGLDEVSIYNTVGIKAMALLDSKLNLTYELALPLKYLPAGIIEKGKFTYDIKLNGLLAIFLSKKIRSGFTALYKVEGGYLPEGPSAIEAMRYTSPTNFSAEYTLAKK